ncbi:glycerophosphoryl diester phosphodiesterase [Mucilaginibacter pineti]|uniref:Glycerophosphoryl diester phosphodiesterase n=1 Tax=Mucilaginibacter pineti TaxID=1391627 RepID=A0A1G6X5Z8_9SPHI|nr:glycerophosphodiester phosphodiesterase family protein [Mucilaginibacter pineti]SDD73542.1 glycerophosphoryl diester phosphodiesterase [Mucilaginibacter pineti]
MKHYLKLIAIILFPFYTAAYSQNKNLPASKILVTAHRGDWRNAPENSLLAFKFAADMGVDIVELDLKKTRDGEIVIMHDDNIDRTCNGKGRPSDYTLQELRTFRLTNALGRVTNSPIPTLREVMLALKDRPVKVNLDKSFDFFSEAYNILNETGTLKQAIFKSDAPYQVLKSRYPQLLSAIIYMPVINLDKPDAKTIIADYLKNMKPYAFEFIFSRDTSALLYHNEFIRKTGVLIWVNSLWASLNGGHDDDMAVEENNKKDSWDWIVARGATILQTDRPLLMLQYLKKKHLHQ